MSQVFESNPLRAGLIREKGAEPCVLVIFGGTGDLARKKLLPALYRLYLEGLLPRAFAVVAYASSEMDADGYRDLAHEAISSADRHAPTEGEKWDSFAQSLRYVRRGDDLAASLNGLKSELEMLDENLGTGGNYLFYFSVPPVVYEEYANGLGEVGLAKEEPGRGWRRVIFEKPFGEDLDSARKLNEALLRVFQENQLYRIDHYLGKETVQNILVFRFANRFVEPLLSAKYVDSIQITVAESIGIEGRGGFYEGVGALRDMVQNHILQVLSLICMEPPASLDPEAIRDERVKVFESIRRIEPSQVSEMVVRGQYSSGKYLGKPVPGYREEDKVTPNSSVETFVALRLHLDNWRWEGVPIYIRTGKRLARRVSEVSIQLKDIPCALFGEAHSDEIEPNVIAISIQPNEGISIKFEAKSPGFSYQIQPVKMDFRYGSAFRTSVPEAYERLLLDAMLGDASLYARADSTEATWQIIDPILKGWKEQNPPVYSYAPGSWGPREAMAFIERDGRRWRRL